MHQKQVGMQLNNLQNSFKNKKKKIAESAAKADIIITTAQIPGKGTGITYREMKISKMKNGSLIIDIAAATGGNTGAH